MASNLLPFVILDVIDKQGFLKTIWMGCVLCAAIDRDKTRKQQSNPKSRQTKSRID
jgi:hypothetical protein